MSDAPRYELKFEAGEPSYHEVAHWIRMQPECFLEPYPERWVNSIYFDTPTLEAYEQNLSGGSNRQKVRYRWYGDLGPLRGGQLEVKVRRNRLGWKLLYPVADPTKPLKDKEGLGSWLRDECQGGGRKWLERYPLPTSVTRYLRRYYATPGGHLRMTIDRRLQLLDLRHSQQLNLTRPLPSTANIIIEIKFAEEHAEDAASLVERLPLRVSRFSKYVSCVSRAKLI